MRNILSNVSSYCFNGSGMFKIPKQFNVFFKSEKVNAFIFFKKDYKIVENESEANLKLIQDLSLPNEGYKIVINDEFIEINYHKDCGAFYGLLTLDELLVGNEIKKYMIFDQPAIKTRGLMLDISRNKVPKIETIKYLIDMMAKLKMNHLELYVEGFSFEYKSFSKYLEEEGYITLDEYKELESYANQRFIDFVPNQNGFGHMGDWLQKDEFKDLAVCPDGIFLWGRHRTPTTLNPLDQRSLELVKKMYADMIPHTKSKYFNMNFDEPFELGHGKTEGMNVQDIYLDFTLKAYDEVKKYQKIPMMWGDVLVKHPDSWNRIPKDVIFIDWGYDAGYSFAKHAKGLHEQGVQFMCAPGTCSWSSFFGRYLDWYENIKNACDAVYDYDGLGVILTDWGDFGHLQFLPISYAPIVYMGLYSWSHKEGTILKVRDYLNDEIFKDSNKVIGDLLLDLGHYSRYDSEYSGNGSKTFYTFMWASCAIPDTRNKDISPITYFKDKMGTTFMKYPKFRIMRKFLNLKLDEIDFIKMDNDLLAIEEIIQTVKMLKMIHKLSLAYNEEVDLDLRIRYMTEVVNSRESFISEQKRLWLARNKSGGLQSSIKHIESFMDFASETLKYLNDRGDNYEEIKN